MNTTIVFVGILVLALLFLSANKKEHYNLGALIQLHAKGPQDTYLTGDAWKYIPPYYYGYNWSPFYSPTRLGKLNYHYYSPYGLTYYS